MSECVLCGRPTDTGVTCEGTCRWQFGSLLVLGMGSRASGAEGDGMPRHSEPIDIAEFIDTIAEADAAYRRDASYAVAMAARGGRMII